MCLILFAYKVHPNYSLVLAANRDEVFRRPTQSLHYWEDAPDILAGRDLEANGTWLGISKNGRLAALTNVRQTAPQDMAAPSRGDLVSNFLMGDKSPVSYLEKVSQTGQRYNGFNLLVGDKNNLCYYSNRGGDIHTFTPGIYGISTCLLDTHWPKIVKGKEGLTRYLSENKKIIAEDLFNILEDRAIPPDDLLPKTGLNLERERLFAPLFIESEGYGTRCSSVILIDTSGHTFFSERTFIQGTRPLQHKTRFFEFDII